MLLAANSTGIALAHRGAEPLRVVILAQDGRRDVEQRARRGVHRVADLDPMPWLR
jgi:hypothetical protein